MAITLKTGADIEAMRMAGRLASEVLDLLTPHVKAGVPTDELDRLAHQHIVQVQGAVPAPLNYAPPGYVPFPKSICTSVNHQVCHGIPASHGDLSRRYRPRGAQRVGRIPAHGRWRAHG